MEDPDPSEPPRKKPRRTSPGVYRSTFAVQPPGPNTAATFQWGSYGPAAAPGYQYHWQQPYMPRAPSNPFHQPYGAPLALNSLNPPQAGYPTIFRPNGTSTEYPTASPASKVSTPASHVTTVAEVGTTPSNAVTTAPVSQNDAATTPQPPAPPSHTRPSSQNTETVSSTPPNAVTTTPASRNDAAATAPTSRLPPPMSRLSPPSAARAPAAELDPTPSNTVAATPISQNDAATAAAPPVPNPGPPPAQSDYDAAMEATLRVAAFLHAENKRTKAEIARLAEERAREARAARELETRAEAFRGKAASLLEAHRKLAGGAKGADEVNAALRRENEALAAANEALRVDLERTEVDREAEAVSMEDAGEKVREGEVKIAQLVGENGRLRAECGVLRRGEEERVRLRESKRMVEVAVGGEEDTQDLLPLVAQRKLVQYVRTLEETTKTMLKEKACLTATNVALQSDLEKAAVERKEEARRADEAIREGIVNTARLTRAMEKLCADNSALKRSEEERVRLQDAKRMVEVAVGDEEDMGSLEAQNKLIEDLKVAGDTIRTLRKEHEILSASNEALRLDLEETKVARKEQSNETIQHDDQAMGEVLAKWVQVVVADDGQSSNLRLPSLSPENMDVDTTEDGAPSDVQPVVAEASGIAKHGDPDITTAAEEPPTEPSSDTPIPEQATIVEDSDSSDISQHSAEIPLSDEHFDVQVKLELTDISINTLSPTKTAPSLATTTPTVVVQECPSPPCTSGGLTDAHLDVIFIREKKRRVCLVCLISHEGQANPVLPRIPRQPTAADLVSHMKREHAGVIDSFAQMSTAKLAEIRRSLDVIQSRGSAAAEG